MFSGEVRPRHFKNREAVKKAQDYYYSCSLADHFGIKLMDENSQKIAALFRIEDIRQIIPEKEFLKLLEDPDFWTDDRIVRAVTERVKKKVRSTIIMGQIKGRNMASAALALGKADLEEMTRKWLIIVADIEDLIYFIDDPSERPQPPVEDRMRKK